MAETHAVLTHYEKIDTSDDQNLFVYKVNFTYYGHHGAMFIWISRAIAEDTYLDLGEIFVEEMKSFLPEKMLPAMFLVDFLALLNDKIPPASSLNNLSPRHSIQYVGEKTIEVNLYPVNGGSYHIPVNAAEKTFDEIVAEVYEKFCKAVAIS